MIHPKLIRKLIQKAKVVCRRAYAPYSHLKVGAALLTIEGRLWLACNVENGSYGLTVCAERSAVFKAISEGDRSFSALAIVSNSKKSISPCGACLQVLNEFNPTLWVITTSASGKIQRKRVSELLPHPFRKP